MLLDSIAGNRKHMTDSNSIPPEPDTPITTGAAAPRALRGVAFGLLFGLTLGVVLFALTHDRRWVGIGIAFGPLLGAAIESARSFPPGGW